MRMCDVCGNTLGHRMGCPEAEECEPEIVGYCELCGNPIEDGEKYFDIESSRYHFECYCYEYLKG